MNWLKRKFAPSEVKVCFSILDDIDRELDNRTFMDVKPHVLNALMNFEKTRYSIFQDKIEPKNLVLIIISNVIGRYLGCGQYHMYRGVLNMQGQELLKIWNYTLNEMMSAGYSSQEEHDEDQKWLKEQIESVG